MTRWGDAYKSYNRAGGVNVTQPTEQEPSSSETPVSISPPELDIQRGEHEAQILGAVVLYALEGQAVPLPVAKLIADAQTDYAELIDRALGQIDQSTDFETSVQARMRIASLTTDAIDVISRAEREIS